MFKKIFLLLMFLCVVDAKEIKILESMQAKFTQKIFSDEHTITYKGEIFALAPRSLLWKYQTPVSKEIYIEQDTMIIYEPQLEQAIFAHLQENLDILNLVHQAVKITQDHYVAEILNQKYHLYFAKGILQRISFEDSMGNQVEIVFEDIQVNPKIDPKIFDFKPASNIDILYN